MISSVSRLSTVSSSCANISVGLDIAKTTMAKSFDVLKPGERAEQKTAAGLDPATDYTTDAECVRCHSTGYGKPGGFVDIKSTPDLAGIGCETCHGPGGTYIQDGYMTLKNKQYVKTEIVAVGMVDTVGEAQCGACHRIGGEELDEGPAAARFRWTSASARLVIPPTDRVRLTLSGARPDGVAPARLSLSVDGVLALEDLEISNEPMEVVIDVPAAQGATSPPGPGASAAETATTRGRNLVLLSTTFRPSQTRNSADERSLGVRLYRVELIGIQDRSNDRDRR